MKTGDRKNTTDIILKATSFGGKNNAYSPIFVTSSQLFVKYYMFFHADETLVLEQENFFKISYEKIYLQV